MADSVPRPGKFIIGVNEFLNINNEHKTWLKNFKPVEQVFHSYLLFDISSEDLRRAVP